MLVLRNDIWFVQFILRKLCMVAKSCHAVHYLANNCYGQFRHVRRTYLPDLLLVLQLCPPLLPAPASVPSAARFLPALATPVPALPPS